MKTFNAIRDALKKKFPGIIVSVRVLKIRSGNCGDTRRNERGFLVRIQKDQPIQVMLDTLVHEFAHCLSFDEWESTGEHGPRWGVALSECYRIYETVVTTASKNND